MYQQYLCQSRNTLWYVRVVVVVGKCAVDIVPRCGIMSIFSCCTIPTYIPTYISHRFIYIGMWEYSHQVRTLPHYQETYRQTAIHIWMDIRLEQKAAAELLMSFNNIVLVRCRFTGSLLFPYMHICKVLGHWYLSLALTQLVPVTIILVK